MREKPPPSVEDILRLYPTWNDALAAAGLPPVPEEANVELRDGEVVPVERPARLPVEPWPRGRCEFWVSDRAMCAKRGRWMVNGQIRCGEHKEV